MTKVGVDAIDKSTTLESDKSLSRCGRGGFCVYVRLIHGGDERIDDTIVSWFRLHAAGLIALSQPMQADRRSL